MHSYIKGMWVKKRIKWDRWIILIKKRIIEKWIINKRNVELEKRKAKNEREIEKRVKWSNARKVEHQMMAVQKLQ